MAGTIQDELPPSQRNYKEEAEDENLWESIIQPAFAEFIGTALYTFMLCMAVTAHDAFMFSMAAGLGLSALCIAFVEISGGHFNPVISLATFISGGLHVVNLLCYLPLQIVGAIIGAAMVKGCVYEPTYTEIKGGATVFRGNHRVNGFNEWMRVNNWDTDPYLAIFVEVILSTFVVMAYLQANIDERRFGKKKNPMIYGLAIACVTVASFYMTGAGYNPAVSFGSAIVSQYWDNHYVYWVGPLAGAGFAALFFRLILGDEEHRLLC